MMSVKWISKISFTQGNAAALHNNQIESCYILLLSFNAGVPFNNMFYSDLPLSKLQLWWKVGLRSLMSEKRK